MNTLELKDICFSYGERNVLENVNLEFEKGKMYAIIGQSGAGKTTLLSIMSGLAKPKSGNVLYFGNDIKDMNKYDYRSRFVGVVFQNFNLLSKLTAMENIVLSMDISGKKIADKKQKAYELLKGVGLTKDECDRRVLKLSGGQQQRVAIARALSYDPEIILADEPTGNLDTETQNEIMAIFRKLAENGKCVIIVTHSPDVSKMCDTVYSLKRK